MDSACARIDAELLAAREAGDTPCMLHLGDAIYSQLKGELQRMTPMERVNSRSISQDQSVAVQYQGLACRQYEELPSTFIIVIRASPHTHTLFGLPTKTVLVPETSEGQAWVDRNKRRRRR